MDNLTKARELLAAEYEKQGYHQAGGQARAGYWDEHPAIRGIIAALTPPEGWVTAVDRELVCAELGVANADDSLEVAAKKLHDLIMWHVQVATDPAVNGGFVLVPVVPTQEMVEAYHGVEAVTARNDEDAEDQWAIESYRAMISARPEAK